MFEYLLVSAGSYAVGYVMGKKKGKSLAETVDNLTRMSKEAYENVVANVKEKTKEGAK